MASISSAGIGSGLDVAGLVGQLVGADRAPEDNRLNAAQSKAKAQLAAYGAIGGVLANLKSALGALQGTSGAFQARKTTSSDESVFTASASGGAVAGSYRVEVQALAARHKLASAGFPTTTTPVGSGRLTIAVGSRSFDVDVDAAAGTPAGIRDAINSSAANTGVVASLITADDGVHLVLTAKDSGTAHALRVTTSGGDGGLGQLVYDPASDTRRLSELGAAADAVIKVEGFTYTGASNEITGAIPGVTLDLVSAKPGTTLELGVATDDGGASKAVASFVQAYNAVANLLRQTTAYNSSTKTAAVLTGDALARSAGATLRNALAASLGGSGGVRSLIDLGVTTQNDGTLAIDNGKLDAALASDPGAAARLFSAEGGLGAALGKALDGYVGSNGAFASRTDSLNDRLDDIADQRTRLDRRMAMVEARYKAQFTALDSLMSQMSATSTFLTRQFASSSSS